MKKAVVLGFILLALGGLAFAQVKVGAWGRGIFTPVAGAGGDAYMGVGESWGYFGSRAGFTVSGTSDNVGFQIDVNTDNGIGIGDQQKIWIQPSSMWKVQIGRIYDDTFRGSASYGAWNYLRFSGMTGDGDIFYRVGETGEKNFELALMPVDGLYAFAAFGGSPSLLSAPEILTDALATGQYGVGYTIKDTGVLRAQYFGMSGATSNYGLINAAFKLTMVKGLTVDLGGFIPTDSAQFGADARVAAYVNYSMDALTINAMGRFSFGTSTGIEAGAGVKYTIGDGVAAEGTVRYLNDVASGSTNGMVGFLLAVQKGFSNGTLGIGVEGTTTSFVWAIPGPSSGTSSFTWAVPVRVEMSF